MCVHRDKFIYVIHCRYNYYSKVVVSSTSSAMLPNHFMNEKTRQSYRNIYEAHKYACAQTRNTTINGVVAIEILYSNFERVLYIAGNPVLLHKHDWFVG